MQKNLLIMIFGRVGSKRLRKKNLKLINKVSLIERTIDFALKIAKNENILVSTNDEKIIKISMSKKVLCPWKRPPYLSRDNTSSYQTAVHAINWYEKKIKKIENILLLQPTTPFRRLSDFKKAYKIFKKSKKTTISYSLLNHKNIFLKKYFLYKKKYLGKKIVSENLYPNGAYFFIKKKLLFKEKDFFAKKINKVVIKNFKYGIDIDTNYDFNIAKKFE